MVNTMLVDEKLQKLITNGFTKDDVIHLTLDGCEVTLRLFDHSSKLLISTPIYYGGNFIPPSVRESALKPMFFLPESIKTFLTIDEQQYKIQLNYLDLLEHAQDRLKSILEDFIRQAHEWRQSLDDQDRNDLIYIHVK